MKIMTWMICVINGVPFINFVFFCELERSVEPQDLCGFKLKYFLDKMIGTL